MILREGTINVSAVNCFGDAVALRGCYHTDKSLHRCTVHAHVTPSQLRRNYCDLLLPLDLDLTLCSDWCHQGASDVTGGGSQRGF